MRSFASDNNATVSSEVMEMLLKVNIDHTIGYGDDRYTQEAMGYFKNAFGTGADIYFLFTGTAANVLGVSAVLKPYQSVLCSHSSHFNVDECAAPERFTGSKLIPIDTNDGKLTKSSVETYLTGFGFEHHAQPTVITISQPTELGTLYSVDEIKELVAIAHHHHMFLHMDGARLSNASVALNKSFKEMTADAGIDILSFGGTKNGLMAAEAVLFFDKKLGAEFKYIRKQGMQLGSKMRYISAQFIAYFQNELWKKNARHANEMTQLLKKSLENITDLNVVYPVQTNALFVKLKPQIIKELKEEFFFYTWDEHRHIVRWMTSFDTTKQDIELFVHSMKHILSKNGYT